MTSGHSMCRVSRVSPGGGLVFFSTSGSCKRKKKNEWRSIEDWKIELALFLFEKRMRMGWVVAGCLRKLTFYESFRTASGAVVFGQVVLGAD